MSPLDYISEQLWAPVFQTGAARVTTSRSADPDWMDVERYWLIPDMSRARLLLPRGPRAATVGSATNYRRLRPGRVSGIRAAAGLLAATGSPLSPHTARVQVRRDNPKMVAHLPLARLARALNCSDSLHASIGVRTGANRKATLSLVDREGEPRGYAKFGWNEVADQFVRTETHYLSMLHGGGHVRTPKVLAHLTYYDHPVLVTEPLPLKAVGGDGARLAPTSHEFSSVSPVYRTGIPACTRHMEGLLSRLAHSATLPLVRVPAREGLKLAGHVRHSTETLPVAKWWHGDLSSWNTARDPDGRLWVWDWETAEDDALAGLDTVHWTFSEHRLRLDRIELIDLRRVINEVGPHLTAVGYARDQWAMAIASYLLTVVDRACELALAHGAWDRVWIQPDQLVSLSKQMKEILEKA